MVNWTEHQKIRSDDPYHCWAYDRQSSLGTRKNGLCPLLIEIKDNNKTPSEYAELLGEFRAHFMPEQDPLFWMSAYDQRHLDYSIERLSAESAETIPDYARLYLVYATEDDLFPDQRRPESAPDNIEFDVLFIGQAVAFDVEANNLRAGDSLNLGDGPKVSLAVIDDSFAFLNEEFINPDFQPGLEMNLSRFNEIWFQSRERIVDGQVQVGAFLDSADLTQHYGTAREDGEMAAYQKLHEVGGEAGGNQDIFQPTGFSDETHQPLAFSVSHGTHVTSTALRSFDAAQKPEESELSLFGVAIPTEVTQDSSGSLIGSYLLAALRQCMLWNDGFFDLEQEEEEIPLVINFSYGFTAGAKDGTDRLAKAVARLLQARNDLGRKTHLVVPMGNAFFDQGLAAFSLEPNGRIELGWEIAPDDYTPSFLEVFAKPSTNAAEQREADPVFRLDVVPPSTAIPPHHFEFDTARNSHHLSQDDAILASWNWWDSDETSEWSTRGVLAVAPTASYEHPGAVAPSGRWRVAVTNTSDVEQTFRLVVQRDDAPGTYPFFGRQSYLDHPLAIRTPTETHSETYANWDLLDEASPVTHFSTASVMASIESDYVIVVGARMGTVEDIDHSGWTNQDVDLSLPSTYTAAGPRLSGKLGPDFAALADRNPHFGGIFAAGTLSGTEVALSGTSVAAPQIAGQMAALLLLDPNTDFRTPAGQTDNNGPLAERLRRTR